MPRVRAGDHHEFLDEVLLVVFVHGVALVVQSGNGGVNNIDAALDNQFSGINLGLGLLNKEQALSYFDVVGHLHDFHLVDRNTAHVHSLLQQFGHEVTNETGVSHQAWLVVGGLVVEAGASSPDHLEALIIQVISVVVHSIHGSNRINDLEVHDDRDVHR